MDANQVRGYVEMMWPHAMKSPVAVAVRTVCAADAIRTEALLHAQGCLNARGGWTVETLSHNIESTFGDDLTSDECDDIAHEVLVDLDCAKVPA